MNTISAQRALETCTGLLTKLDALQGKIRNYCTQAQIIDLRIDFSDVRTAACALKGELTAACVCAEKEEPPTLAQIRAERHAQPDHKMRQANDHSLELPLHS